VIDQVCCTASNDYCGSKFAALAMEEPAGPYLGCEAAPGATGSTDSGFWMLALLLLIGVRRRAAVLAAPVLVLFCAAPAPANAEPTRAFASVEGHGSFLNDSPNASLLDVTFGYSARGGYRWGRWRAVIHVEHNAWLVTEYGAAVNAGAFNLGVGAEVLLFDDLIRIGLVVGPSLLLFDTPLDDSGSTGIFSDLRPLGFRYEVADGVIVTFDPLTMSVVAPVLGDPPLRKIERRTYAGMEMGFF
jgi:MYXO-CTERM domain-containing protein